MTRRLTCTALLAAGVAAGCGGVSKEEYSEQANRVCSQIQKDLQAVSQGGQTNDPAEINRRTDRAVDAFQNGVNRIKGLERPGGEAGEKAEQFTQAFERFLTEDYRPGVEKLQKAVSSRDRQAVRRAALELRDIDTQNVNRLAEQANVRECASGS
jgi:uncharacterized protein YukE